MADEIPKSYITCIAIICLSVITVIVLIAKTNHFLLESLIVVIAGLAGYNLKGALDEKTITELKKIIEGLKNDKPEDNG